MPVSRLLSLFLAMLFTVTLCLLLLLAVAQTLSAVHSGQRFSEQVSSAVSLGDNNGDRAAAETLIPCDARVDCFNPAYSPPLLLRRCQAPHLKRFARSHILTGQASTPPVRSVAKHPIYGT